MIEPLSIFDPVEAPLHSWSCVNDGVMGGVSQSEAVIDDHQYLQWYGHVSLARNGGFASVRHHFAGVDLHAYSGFCLLLKGDGKMYKLNLGNQLSSGSPRFQARFKAYEQYHLVYIPFSCLAASVRGTPVSATFDPAKLSLLGFLIADAQAGPFHLTVQRISAYV
jgi:hypothetical protein